MKTDGFITRKPTILTPEDGSIFKGFSLGKIGTATGEICYNTGMTVPKVYTDPSYFGQIIINTSYILEIMGQLIMNRVLSHKLMEL